MSLNLTLAKAQLQLIQARNELTAKPELMNDAEHWITVNGGEHPETGEKTGRHILINGEGEVIGGAGGALNGKKLGNVKSKSGDVEKPKAKEQEQKPARATNNLTESQGSENITSQLNQEETVDGYKMNESTEQGSSGPVDVIDKEKATSFLNYAKNQPPKTLDMENVISSLKAVNPSISVHEIGVDHMDRPTLTFSAHIGGEDVNDTMTPGKLIPYILADKTDSQIAQAHAERHAQEAKEFDALPASVKASRKLPPEWQNKLSSNQLIRQINEQAKKEKREAQSAASKKMRDAVKKLLELQGQNDHPWPGIKVPLNGVDLSESERKFLNDIQNKRILTTKQAVWLEKIAARSGVEYSAGANTKPSKERIRESSGVSWEEADIPTQREDGSWYDAETGFDIVGEMPRGYNYG